MASAALALPYASDGKGWFMILRLDSPLEPSFTKEWRPSEIELVR